ncbi:hypothetical protein DFH09DRAFT_1142129 [Mycena vulgaris]|nr:hypothetical protein DFH09DRAFT_1142129 [Mycena vulgaris]
MAPQSASPTARRSRRPFPSPSISKSPDSDRPKDPVSRPKRLKQEDIDPGVDVHPPSVASSTSSVSNGRAKRKTKEKEKDRDRPSEKDRPRTDDQPPDPAPDAPQPVVEEEENGVTRCICGREDDPDAGEFMVQCETCKVWQHGLCMGYDSEALLQDDDYYCEQCRPEFHTEYLKKSRRKARHSSTTSHHTAAPPRQSRSHSPSYLKQPSKRRNTMNSRDAAFDENLKEILETTAAEAGATHDPAAPVNGNGHPELEEDGEPAPANRKKRKRTEDDAPAKKRTRSASSASDRRMASVPRDESPPPSKVIAPPKPPGRRRGGRKAVVHELVVSIEGEEVALPAPNKRGHAGRAKGANASKRTAVSAAPPSMIHEHATRRNNTTAPNGHASTSTAVESSRTYRNSHAYAVSQQPMFTSWNLPDYLAHLEEILPSETPQPLEVLSGGPPASTSRAGSLERTMERGVKVKWPSKRMSVGDMNKRVRALVEWVGREQASASERGKRKEALESALREEVAKETARLDGVEGAPPDDSAMAVDPPGPDKTGPKYDVSQASAAMKMMEELMEELIRFQERFGPGAKRDRRAG